MKRFLALGLLFAAAITIGCGDAGPTNVMENADKAAVAEYERLLAEEDAANAAAPPDQEAAAPNAAAE